MFYVSILNALDVKFKFLMSQVELIWFLLGSRRIELEICSIRLESGWKCGQPDFGSGRIQNVDPKLDPTISLRLKELHKIVFRGYSKVKQNAIVIALTTSATRSFSTLSFAITTCTWIRISVDVYFRRLFWKLRMRWICPCRSRPILVIAF